MTTMCSRMTSLSRLETSDHFHTHCSLCPCGLTMTGMCRRGTLRTTSRIGVRRLSRWSNSRMARLSRLEMPDRSHSCRSQSGRPDRIGQPRTRNSSCATWCPPCQHHTTCSSCATRCPPCLPRTRCSWQWCGSTVTGTDRRHNLDRMCQTGTDRSSRSCLGA